MKNTFKFLLFTFVALGLWSCEDESNLMILTPPAEFSIITPDAGTAITLNPDLGTNPALTVTWSPADYGNQTMITYIVEIAATGTDFANPIEAASTNNTNITWSVLELNGAAVGAGLIPFEQGGIDIRIKATVGTNGAQPVYSNSVTVLVTTFSTNLPLLAVPGNHQGWNPPTAPRIAASAFGATDFEGFMSLDGEYKFVAPDSAGNFNWGNTDWGDDGTFSDPGILVNQDGEQNCQADPGYYLVRANTTTLTYSATLTNWGIIGSATPGGWDNSTALTYNASTGKWTSIVTLSSGAFKFRANNDWAINLGGAADGMNFNGDDIVWDTPGTYLVELDLSTPRQYTYTLTPQ